MASEKVASILRSRGAPFTEEQIAEMPDNLGWQWIYAHDKEQRETERDLKLPEICFTGFSDPEKERLAEVARQVGFEVKDSVTKSLKILVAGENAGWKKLEKAKAQDCLVTDEAGFMAYIESQKNAG